MCGPNKHTMVFFTLKIGLDFDFLGDLNITLYPYGKVAVALNGPIVFAFGLVQDNTDPGTRRKSGYAHVSDHSSNILPAHLNPLPNFQALASHLDKPCRRWSCVKDTILNYIYQIGKKCERKILFDNFKEIPADIVYIVIKLR